MNTVPRNWVWAAAVVLSLTALGSLVLGATRGGPGRDAVSDIGALAPVPDAAAAKPIADLTAEDAHFRQIAREEAQAALGRTSAPRPKATPKPDENDSDDTASSSTTLGDSGSGPTIHTPSTTLKTAAAPATPAAVAGQRALLGSSARSTSSSTTSTRPTSGLSNPYPPGSSPD